jgi:hypothetical protein
MSNPQFPPLPLPDDDRADDLATTDDDGETRLDPDADDELIDSADADRIAATGDDDDDAFGEQSR